MTRSPIESPKRRRRAWRHAGLATLALAAAVVPATPANADYFYSRSEAQRVTKKWVASYYADTYSWNISSSCRPQSRRYDPNYEYHRWVCTWYDVSDGTAGKVLIVGSRGSGNYYYKVLRGAH